MRISLIVMAILCSISNTAFAQQWQTLFSVDSRIGYSSNTYLNPYFSEWDNTLNSGYGMISGVGQTIRYGDNSTFKITGAGAFEPFLKNRDALMGGLGMAEFQRHFTSTLSGGVQAGGSYFRSSFKRRSVWVQPTLSWSPSAYTRLMASAGSNFRSYKNFAADSLSTSDSRRSDIYSLRFETWPSFRWRITAGLYGNLATLPAVQEAFSSVAGGRYTFSDGSSIRLTIGLEQYQNERVAQVSGGGGGFAPIGGPPSSTQTVEETSRIYRLGIEGSVPITGQLSGFMNVKGLQFSSTATGNTSRDMHISGGVRLQIQPDFNRREKGTVAPEWEKVKEEHRVVVHYSGQGQLYLVGDFNNWKRPGIPLVETKEGRYLATIQLDPGSYEYKVIVVENGEEKWIEFSKDIYTVDDGFGGQNGLVLIEQ